MLFASVIAVLGMGACANAPQVRLPQPLQPATPLPTDPPTATPSPSPSPVPTLLPGVVVAQGNRDLHNGDWDSAMQAFEQIVADPAASPDELVEAQLGLAEASLRRGDFGSARAVLDALLAQYPDHPRAAQAYFLRGDALLGLSDWVAAINDYNTYLGLRPGLIDSYVHERIADAYLALGMNEQAIAAYDQSIAAGRYTVGQLQLLEKVATIHRALGNYDAAIAQYQAILAIAENSSYRAVIDYYIAQTYLEAGNTDAGYQQLSFVFMTYPESYEALSALRALLDAEIGVDQFQRGVVNFNQGQYDVALEAFYNYLAATSAQYPPDVHLYIARSYRQLGNIQAALTELQAMIGRFGPEDGSAWGDAWLELADIQGANGAPDAAYASYETFVAEHSELPQAPTALYDAAMLARSLGDPARATGYLQRLATEYPSDTRAAVGMFDVALDAYQAGDYATAATWFQTAASLPANERPAAAHFWLGKTLQTSRQPDQAAAAFGSAIAADAGRYYALRARDAQSGQPAFAVPPGGFTLPADLDEGRAEAEQWIVQTFALAETPPLGESLRADLATDPRMLRARELWELGLLVEAKQDFEAVRRDFQDDPLATYQLSIYFREIGLYRSSLLAAWRLMDLANVGPLEGPPFLARLRYPIYFSELILASCEQYGLDPLWVYSLIWQESLFEGFAVSTASAQGLMQIWPPTGEDIAAALSWPAYQPSDLQRPVVSIAFGTWLLRDELDRFDGSPYAALAAYNAGPGNTQAWAVASQGDPDLLVEVITLSEPKLYLQRIVEHYDIYRALYGGSAP
jgi:soluble lytic murein transglycosylase